MNVLYAKVTSKGQVTLPAELRRELDISAGSMIAFRSDGDHVTVESATSIEATRAKLERASKRNGTWGKTIDDIHGPWRDAAVERYARS